MSEKLTTCKWCKTVMPDDAGAYYHEADCHRKDVLRRMKLAEEQGASASVMAKLERELYRASYTGD